MDKEFIINYEILPVLSISQWFQACSMSKYVKPISAQWILFRGGKKWQSPNMAWKKIVLVRTHENIFYNKNKNIRIFLKYN